MGLMSELESAIYQESLIKNELATKFVVITGNVKLYQLFDLIKEASAKGDNYHPVGIYPREEYEGLSWKGIYNRINSEAKKSIRSVRNSV